MATTLYVRNLAAQLWAGTASRFSTKDASRGVTPGSELFEGATNSNHASLQTTVGTGTGIAYTRTSVVGPTSGILCGSLVSPYGIFSPPIAADFTLSGSITFNMCGLESSMNANASFRMALYRVDAEGALTLILNSYNGTELNTAVGRITWSDTPTSTAMKKGDRLLLVPMFDDATAVTMASGFTLTLQGGGAAASTADSNFVLTEDVTFTTTDPAGTTYYLRDTASDLALGAQVEKVLSTTQGSGTAEAVHTTVVGPLTFPGDQWTASAGGSDVEWYTPQLEAFTLGGVVKVNITNAGTAFESTATPFDALTCEIAVVNADGSLSSVWSRSYTSTDSTASPKSHYCTGPDLAVTQGQRIRLRFFQDELRPFGNAVAGTNRTIRYGGVSTYASALTFTQTITEYTPGGPVSGTGSSALGGVGSTATGAVRIAGSGAGELGGVGSEATAAVRITGSGSSGMGGVGSDAAGTEKIPGTGSSAVAGVGSAATGSERITGTGSSAVAGVGSDATGSGGSVPVTGSGSSALGGVGSTGTGSVRITGTGASAVAGVGSSATATERITGSGSSAMAGIGSSAVATEQITGTGAGDVAGVGSTATGAVRITGTATGAIAGVGSSATATEHITGTAAASLAGVGSSATGTAIVPTITGTATGSLAGVGSTATGSAAAPGTVTGSASGALAGVGSTATGTVTVPTITGTAAGAIGGVGSAAVGTERMGGTASGALGGVGGTATGTAVAPTITGTGDGGLGGVGSTATGTVANPGAIVGTATGSLGGVASTATGTVTAPTIIGTASSAVAGTESEATGSIRILAAAVSAVAGVGSTASGVIMVDGVVVIGEPRGRLRGYLSSLERAGARLARAERLAALPRAPAERAAAAGARIRRLFPANA